MGYPTKGEADYLELGDWNATCAECGRKGKASRMVKLPPGVPGSGLYVHPEHYTPRQPQDFVQGVPDIQTPPWSQPQSDATVNVCDLVSISCIADYAAADCSTCDLVPNGIPEDDNWIA